MPRKPVVPAAVADALTAEKPPSEPPAAARAVRTLSGDSADEPQADALPATQADSLPAVIDLSAPIADDIAFIQTKDVETITAEVIQLQGMGNRCLLEIGKRLIAAKDKLSHGDWLPFLERVNISPRFAQRYMRLAREWTNATSLSYLGMTKALALLALPDPEERDAFAAEQHVVDGELKSVDEMSVRELDAAIKARQEAESAAKIAESKVSVLEMRLKESEQDADAQRRELVRANQRLELANAETEKARAEAIQARKDAEARLEQAETRLGIAQKAKEDAETLLDRHQTAYVAVCDELNALKNKPIEVAVQKVADPEAIEAAKREERESMQTLIDKANKEREKAKEKAHRLEGELGFAKNDLAATIRRAQEANADLEKANQAAAEAAKDAQTARAELERVKAEAKAAPLADSDITLFGVLFEQVKATANQMHGILLKRADEKKESMRKALLSLSEQLRKAAES